MLRRALAELQFVLEQSWGLIGWELKHVRTLGDIRAVFSAVTGFNGPRLDLFRKHPTERTTPAALRLLREELADALDENRKAYAAFMQSKEAAERASQVLAGAQDEKSRQSVQSLKAAFGRKYEEASAALEIYGARIHELQSKLDRQEAYFAQSQLLDFIQSGRREFTPLNIAMAMAGIPLLTARVSCERCSALNPGVEPGHAFQMFQAVEGVFARQPGDMDDSIERMRAYLLAFKTEQLPPHIAELRNNWYFLESAIVAAYRVSKPRSSALPYSIFAEYKRRLECQSQMDVLLAQENRL